MRAAFVNDARLPDKKLHASGHLTAPLRHVQLEMADSPQKPRTITDDITLMTGTIWHSYLNKVLFDRRAPVMMEVKLDEYMPDGWSGTADWIIWNPAHQAFLLSDLKTIRGAGLGWILSAGAKEAHMFQLSAYFWALKKMGLPLVNEFTILYLPKDAVPGKDVQPTLVECKPIDEALILALMQSRKNDVDLYLAGMSELAPIPPRELKRVWDKKRGVFDVTLKPHWSSAYCRFLDCGCSDQGQTKLGEFKVWNREDSVPNPKVIWAPRKGLEEEIEPHAEAIEKLTPLVKEFR